MLRGLFWNSESSFLLDCSLLLPFAREPLRNDVPVLNRNPRLRERLHLSGKIGVRDEDSIVLTDFLGLASFDIARQVCPSLEDIADTAVPRALWAAGLCS